MHARSMQTGIKMKRFYIITNRLKDSDLQVTEEIKRHLNMRGAEAIIQVEAAEQATTKVYTNSHAIPQDIDCVIVLGGDGTLLQAARDTSDRGIPLLGINMGTLGYLAEVEMNYLEQALDRLIADEFDIEKRMMLFGQMIDGDYTEQMMYALNDICITRTGSLQILNFNIYVNGQLLNRCSADGLIISTPTGSTGYNMSAGGPIVEPKAQLIVLTPICAHTLNTRSIVLSAEDEVIVEIAESRDGRRQLVEANADGADTVIMKTGERIRIVRSERTTSIVKMSKVSFLETLYRKMSE